MFSPFADTTIPSKVRCHSVKYFLRVRPATMTKIVTFISIREYQHSPFHTEILNLAMDTTFTAPHILSSSSSFQENEASVILPRIEVSNAQQAVSSSSLFQENEASVILPRIEVSNDQQAYIEEDLHKTFLQNYSLLVDEDELSLEGKSEFITDDYLDTQQNIDHSLSDTSHGRFDDGEAMPHHGQTIDRALMQSDSHYQNVHKTCFFKNDDSKPEIDNAVLSSSSSPHQYEYIELSNSQSNETWNEPKLTNSATPQVQQETQSCSNSKKTTTELRWYENYEKLAEFKKRYGHCTVPRQKEEHKQLSSWIQNQRHKYKRTMNGEITSLNTEHINLLADLGFKWVPGFRLPDLWNQRYKELQDYKKDTGHCNVPQKYKENRELAAWVSTQRTHYQKLLKGQRSSMTRDRIEMLEKIGFEWSHDQWYEVWHERYEELKNFKKHHGHCNVSRSKGCRNQLKLWVSYQRTQYRMLQQGKSAFINDERVKLLEELGFEWSLIENFNDLWQRRYEELAAFKQKYGHSNVPKGYEKNKQLAYWVITQRHQYYKRGKGQKSYITMERIKILEKLGFEWNIRRK